MTFKPLDFDGDIAIFETSPWRRVFGGKTWRGKPSIGSWNFGGTRSDPLESVVADLGSRIRAYIDYVAGALVLVNSFVLMLQLELEGRNAPRSLKRLEMHWAERSGSLTWDDHCFKSYGEKDDMSTTERGKVPMVVWEPGILINPPNMCVFARGLKQMERIGYEQDGVQKECVKTGDPENANWFFRWPTSNRKIRSSKKAPPKTKRAHLTRRQTSKHPCRFLTWPDILMSGFGMVKLY